MIDLRQALKFYLLGILLYPLLMNIAIFVSPIFSQIVYGEGSEHHQDLKLVAKKVLPFFSLLYIIGSYHLSKLTGIFGKVALFLFSVWVVLSYILHIIVPGTQIIFIWSTFIRIDYLLLTTVIIIVMNYIDSSTQRRET